MTSEPADTAASGVRGRIVGKVKEKVGAVVERVAESETVQKSVDKVKAMSQKVAESERVQQSVEYVKRKTTEIAEMERVQKGVEIAKESARVASEKATKVHEAVSEKTKESIEYAKEKGRAVVEGAGSVWNKGRGSIQRVRAEVSKIAWKGSARDTLDMAAREEQWKGIKVQGAEELAVPARTEHTSTYHVSKGATLRWTFRVKEHDIGFGVRMRVQEWGGSREEEVLAIERYDSADTISGSWVADENRTIVLSFDNRYSRLRSKTVAYIVGTEKPPAFEEPVADSTAAGSAPQAAQGEAASPSVRAIV